MSGRLNLEVLEKDGKQKINKMKPTVKDVKEIHIKCHEDSRGLLFPLEFADLPIKINRIFYVTDVKDQSVRGEHSHYKTKQILICLKGECLVRCKDGKEVKEWSLKSPSTGLFIPNMIWDEQIYSTPDTILLVLSDTSYDKSDYIEDWDEYCNIMTSLGEENVL